MGKYALKVDLQGDVYYIPIATTEQTLQSVCRRAALKHLKKRYALDETEARVLFDTNQVMVADLRFEGGLLDIDEKVGDLGLDSGSLLHGEFALETLELLRCIIDQSRIPPKKLDDSDQPEGIERPAVKGGDVTIQLPEWVDSRGPPKFRNFSHFKRYSAREILLATRNFSESNLLASGGQAKVYRGCLPGIDIAVKKFGEDLSHEVEKEIQVFSRVPHPHLLLLMGWCPEEKCFVSEFMAGGSLLDRLRDSRRRKFPPLTWFDRLRIVKEVLSALIHLHKEKIIHRDLKPGNILLDENCKVRVADMGLAHSFEKTALFKAGQVAEERVTGGVMGTVGYIDPAYLEEGRIGPELDVFALGVIVLQLCMDEPSVGTVRERAADLSSDCLDAVQDCLAAEDGSLQRETMQQLLVAGLECSRRAPKDRPTLSALWLRVEKMIADNTSNGSGRGEPQQQAVRRVESENFKAGDMRGFFLSHGSIDTVELTVDISSKLSEYTTILVAGAEAGNAEEQHFLGRCYRHGFGTFKVDHEKANKWMKKASDGGLVEAKKDLEQFFDKSFYMLKRPWLVGKLQRREALHQLERGALSEIPVALVRLGECLRAGYGCERDVARAMELFMMAARAGHDGAKELLLEALGEVERLLQSVKSDSKLIHIGSKLEAVAMAGIPEAQTLMGVSFLKAWRPFPLDHGAAYEWLKKAHSAGHPHAITYICSLCGILFDKVCASSELEEGKVAVQLLQSIAKSGFTEAMYFLGLVYYDGIGVLSDNSRSLNLLSKAAEKGHVLAQWMLAFCYEGGIGLGQDSALAFTWRTKSLSRIGELERVLRSDHRESHVRVIALCLVQGAEVGIVEAQVLLAKCYLFGWGFDVDYQEALKWVKLARAQGRADVHALLESHFETHFRVVRKRSILNLASKQESVRQLEKGAAAGISLAQLRLSECYNFGYGVKQNPALAMEWYNIAHSSRNDDVATPAEIPERGREKAAERRFLAGGMFSDFLDGESLVSDLYLDGVGPYSSEKGASFAWLKRAFKDGDTQAEEQLALLAAYAHDSMSSTECAAELWPRLLAVLRELASLGIAEAQFRMGLCYQAGCGVGPDGQVAVEWYKEAAGSGHLLSPWVLSLHFSLAGHSEEAWAWQELAEGNIDDLAEALRREQNEATARRVVQVLEQTAARGSGPAGLALGLHFLHLGGTVSADFQKAYFLLRQAQLQKHARADGILKQLFEALYDAAKPASQAKHRPRQSFSRQAMLKLLEISRAQKTLGKWTQSAIAASTAVFHNESGLGGSRDAFKVNASVSRQQFSPVALLREAAMVDCQPEAAFWLGECFFHGYGVEHGPAKAVDLYLFAAGANVAAAEFRLGLCYASGEGVTESKAEAVPWFRKAAEGGHSQGQLHLGLCHLLGSGLPVDEGQAAHWFCVAAAAGQSRADWELGLCYENGVGVEKSREQALEWMRRAAAAHLAEAAVGLPRRLAAYSPPVHYQWGVQQYSSLRDGGLLFSPPFAGYGVFWKLTLKLNGEGSEASHLSAKLSLAYPFQLGGDWSLLVHFTISVTSRTHPQYSRVLEGFEEFSRHGICWGHDNHTPICLIEDSCRGLLVEDTLAVEAMVRAKLTDGSR